MAAKPSFRKRDFSRLGRSPPVLTECLRDSLRVLNRPAPEYNCTMRIGFSFRGWFALFGGAIAILVGAVTPRNKEAFLIAGAVSCCWGCYFLYLGKKLRRGGATAAKSRV
jgi:hypothetical protein